VSNTLDYQDLKTQDNDEYTSNKGNNDDIMLPEIKDSNGKTLKVRIRGAIFSATCLAMAMRHKLQHAIIAESRIRLCQRCTV
jgi:hypothetical protein